MYSPGQITATETAGGGIHPQIGGLVQGVPPKEIPSMIGIIAIRPRFSPKAPGEKTSWISTQQQSEVLERYCWRPESASWEDGWIWISHGDLLSQVELCSSKNS